MTGGPFPRPRPDGERRSSGSATGETAPRATAPTPREPGQPSGGVGTLALITATVTGMGTALFLIGPLLLDLSRDLDISIEQAGLLGAAMSIPASLLAPFAGLLSDRVGRRPLITLALVGAGLASIVVTLAPNFPTLLATRLVTGICFGFAPASLMGSISDLFPASRRAMAMSWLNMGFSLAAVAGVPIVSVIGGLFGWRSAFLAVGVTLLVLAVLMRLLFPDSRSAVVDASVLATYRGVVRVPKLGNVLCSNLLERAVYSSVTLYLPSFLMLSYGFTVVDVALPLAFIAGGSILGNMVGGWLGDRFDKATFYAISQTAAAAIALALFTLPAGLVLSTLGGVLFGLFNTASRGAFLAIGAGLTHRNRGAVLGILSLTNQGGLACGAAIGGVVIGLGGYSGLGVFTATGVLLAAVLALPLARRG